MFTTQKYNLLIFIMIRVAICGGLGYLGNMLYDVLSNESIYEIIILDNNLYGCINTRPYVYLDITDEQAVNIYFNSNTFDVLINLSAIVGDPACNSNHELAIKVNCIGTKNIVNVCIKHGIKLVHYSTCSVYGSQFNTVMTEESNVLPIDFYGQLKLFQEKYILEKCPDAIILRLGTVYGLSQRIRYDLVVNLFIAQAVRDQKITVFGGTQERPFVHGKDVARCVDHLLKKGLSGLYNISGMNYSILQIAEEIQKNLKSTEILVNENVIDKRNYLVSSDKLIGTGFTYNYTISDAFTEIQSSDSVQTYTDDVYSNFKLVSKDKIFNFIDFQPKLFDGNLFVDDRGVLSFVNSFMKFNTIKRFYQVNNHNSSIIRAFHGHKREAKYVYVTTGSAIIIITKIIDERTLDIKFNRYILSDKIPKILYIPPGYANGFKPLEEHTNIMFFSTTSLEESKNDDVRYSYDILGQNIWETENR